MAVAAPSSCRFKSASPISIVPTGSMKPTILEGDLVTVNKLAYDLKFLYLAARPRGAIGAGRYRGFFAEGWRAAGERA